MRNKLAHFIEIARDQDKESLSLPRNAQNDGVHKAPALTNLLVNPFLLTGVSHPSPMNEFLTVRIKLM